jgi:uncharacterized protein YfaS (alpha-2-macroglobulin family)
MAETAVQKAQRQFEEARARLQSAKARESSAERKKETRRKVVLGGALIELATRDDEAAAMTRRLVDGLSRDQDRKTFKGWDAPVPTSENGSGGNTKGGGQNDITGDSRFDLPPRS